MKGVNICRGDLKDINQPSTKTRDILGNNSIERERLTGYGSKVEVLSDDLLKLAVYGAGCEALTQI